ncbi:hypothetical protein B0H16DRAFT_1317483, partial [Mycena metata]
FFIPPPQLSFRIISYSTGKPFFSTAPAFGLASDAKNKDPNQYFSLIPATGTHSGLYLIRGKKSKEALFSNKRVSTTAGSGGQFTDDCFFKLVPGKFGFKGQVRLVAPSTSTVITVPSGSTRVVNQPFNEKDDPASAQFLSFQYDDMSVDGIQYDLPNAKILEDAPAEIGRGTFHNPTTVPQPNEFKRTKISSETSTFEFLAGFTLSAEATFEAGIPVVSSASFTLGVSTSQQWTWGKSSIVQRTYSVSSSIVTNPNYQTVVVSTYTIGKLQVPFTIYSTSKATGVKVTTEGVWTGTSGWNVQTNLINTGLGSPALTGSSSSTPVEKAPSKVAITSNTRKGSTTGSKVTKGSKVVAP